MIAVFLHVQDAVSTGSRRVKIRTVDTDVVVIAICLFGRIAGLEELWIDFGVGKNRRFYPIHEIIATLGEMKCRALIFFHAFTGCDQVSFFSHCGKTKAWKAWSNLPEVTETFVLLGSKPAIGDVTKSMQVIEKFVTTMYKSTTTCVSVNDLRREMFIKESKDLGVNTTYFCIPLPAYSKSLIRCWLSVASVIVSRTSLTRN